MYFVLVLCSQMCLHSINKTHSAPNSINVFYVFSIIHLHFYYMCTYNTRCVGTDNLNRKLFLVYNYLFLKGICFKDSPAMPVNIKMSFKVMCVRACACVRARSRIVYVCVCVRASVLQQDYDTRLFNVITTWDTFFRLAPRDLLYASSHR